MVSPCDTPSHLASCKNKMMHASSPVRLLVSACDIPSQLFPQDEDIADQLSCPQRSHYSPCLETLTANAIPVNSVLTATEVRESNRQYLPNLPLHKRQLHARAWGHNQVSMLRGQGNVATFAPVFAMQARLSACRVGGSFA